MVALAVVLGDELPVGVDVVDDLLRRLQVLEVEPVELVDEIAEVVLDRLRLLGRQAQEDEPLPGRDVDRPQAVLGEAEVLEVVGVLRPDQRPVEVVDPRVVRALEAHGLAALALLDGRAPVLAHVVERPDRHVAAAHDDDVLAVELDPDERRRLRDVLLARREDPVRPHDMVALPLQDRWVVVGAGGQQAGGAVFAADRRELGVGEDGPGHVRCLRVHRILQRPGGPHGAIRTPAAPVRSSGTGRHRNNP